jgi:hypothetical protein
VSIDHITDHDARAKARLVEQFKRQANFLAFFTIAVRQVQDLEDAFFDFLTAFILDNAVGAQLDLLGRIVGQLRGGLDDTTYRLYLRARIKANRSSGTLPELLEIIRLICPPTATIQAIRYQPAAVIFSIDNIAVTDATATAIMKFLRIAKAGGVRIIFEFLTVDPTTVFSAFDDPTGPGFGDNTDASIGGWWAQAVDVDTV